jgi:hypothetical protein
VEELGLVLGQLLVEFFDVGVLGKDGRRPGRTPGKSVNRLKERAGAVGGQGAIEGVGRAGFDGHVPFPRRQEFIDGKHFVAGAGHLGRVFVEMAQVVMGQINGDHHADHLVEITGLIVEDVVLPKARVNHHRQLDGEIVPRRSDEILHVLIEEARLNAVDGLGVGKMIDKVNKTRRDGDLAQDFALIPAGYGGDLREVLRLQGNGLGGQLFAEFFRQGFRQIAAPVQRDAEAAGIRPGWNGVLAGRRQGGGE